MTQNAKAVTWDRLSPEAFGYDDRVTRLDEVFHREVEVHLLTVLLPHRLYLFLGGLLRKATRRADGVQDGHPLHEGVLARPLHFSRHVEYLDLRYKNGVEVKDLDVLAPLAFEDVPELDLDQLGGIGLIRQERGLHSDFLLGPDDHDLLVRFRLYPARHGYGLHEEGLSCQRIRPRGVNFSYDKDLLAPVLGHLHAHLRVHDVPVREHLLQLLFYLELTEARDLKLSDKGEAYFSLYVDPRFSRQIGMIPDGDRNLVFGA